MVRFRWFALAVALAVTASLRRHRPSPRSSSFPPSYHAKTQPPVAVQSFLLTLMQQGGNWDDKYRHVVKVLATKST